MYTPVAIPALPRTTDPALRQFLSAIKESLEVRVNQRGNAMDASPTFRDLLDAGVISIKDGMSIGGRNYTQDQLLGLVESSIPGWVTSDTAPMAPTGLLVGTDSTNTKLTWDAPTFESYLQTQVWRAESNNLSNAIQVGSTSGAAFLDSLPPVGTVYYYWVRDEARNGLTGPFNDVNGAPTSGGAEAPVVSYGFEGPDVVLTWPTPASNLAVQFYTIAYDTGSAWAVLDVVGGNAARFKVTWSGTRQFRVTATDIGGKLGAQGAFSVAIAPCVVNTLSAEVIDNNVLMRWTSTKGSLPIERFELRKGISWAASTLVGLKDGGFTTVFETVAGTYTYWMAGLDSAGNYSAPVSVTSTVTQPPDYVLATRWTSGFGGTKSNALREGTGITLPINTTETWAQHFSGRSWVNPQAQIDTGYPIYGQPGATTGYYEEVFDYGATLAAMKVTVNHLLTVVSGGVTSAVTITVAQDAGFTAGVQTFNAAQAFAVNFRYVKVRITATAPNATGLATLSGLVVTLDAKLKTFSGVVTTNAADAGGTVVYLTDDRSSTGTKVYVDVDAINLTPLATAATNVVYDFVDAPNPQSFKVLAFDSAGARATRTVSYTVRGY